MRSVLLDQKKENKALQGGTCSKPACIKFLSALNIITFFACQRATTYIILTNAMETNRNNGLYTGNISIFKILLRLTFCQSLCFTLLCQSHENSKIHLLYYTCIVFVIGSYVFDASCLDIITH